MSWCDKLASTPTVGFLVDHHIASSDAILDSVAPLLDSMAKAESTNFEIDRHESLAIGFTSNDGFQFVFEPTRIVVGFKHRLRAKPTSAGLPIMELISRAAPYTELLTSVSDRLVNATLMIPAADKRSVRRIGIISQTVVAQEELPPGLERMIQHLGQPWGKLTGGYSFSVTTPLGEKKKEYSDRCIHNVVKAEGDDELVNLSFDWQRAFDNGRPIKEQTLRDVLRESRAAALDYFEELAEGNRFDEAGFGRTA